MEFLLQIIVIRHQQRLIDQGALGGGGDVATCQRRDRAGNQCEHPHFVDLDDHSPVYPEILGNGRDAVVALAGTCPSTLFLFRQ